MAIVGTAGHVDHGKSTLVRALTGRDPDRWAEEKARGLTIDLGFAWAEIGGHQVGFVDVPGHEKFVKNMLAGVGGISVGLFVVAADEGWMPQTEEHFSVLDLLDVRHGVIALTKVDSADRDVAELAQIEVEEHVAGTSLAGWPIVCVAAPTGAGLDDLRVALATALDAAGPPPDRGRPRLWIDRGFTVAGAGVVVTGTLVDGILREGDEIIVLPAGVGGRVRGLQSHEATTLEALPGSRTAVNLSGVDLDDVARGAMLTHPDMVGTTRAVLAWLRPVRGLDENPTDRGSYQAHVGTGAWPVTIRTIGDPGADGQAALIRFRGQVPVTMGDRFILRDTGRRSVVAGGVVLDPDPPSQRGEDLIAATGRLLPAVAAGADDRAGALLAGRGMAGRADLARLSGGGTANGALHSARWSVDAGTARGIVQTLAGRLGEYHERHPLRPGEPKATVASGLGLDNEVLELVVSSDPTVVDDGSVLRLAAFGGGWGDRQEADFAAAATALRGDGLAVRRASQIDLSPETLHAALRSGRLTRLADDLIYLPEQIDEMLERLVALPDGFTVAEFRDEMGMSRRHAVPVLEWLDANGWTSRRGDVRTVRRRQQPAPDDAPSR